MIEYDGLPQPLREGARRWIENAIPPGQFLAAMFSGRLFDAVHFADDDRLRDLGAVGRWIYLNAPPASLGENRSAWKGTSYLKGQRP